MARPCAGVEAPHILAQDLKIHIPDENAVRVVEVRVGFNPRLFKKVLRETGEGNIFQWQLCAKTGKLAELFGCEIGLDVILKGCDQVWDLCDGRKTVGEIIVSFSKVHKLNRKETEVAMLTYFRELAKRRLVGLQVPLEPHEE